MSITIESLWKDRKRYLGMPLSFTRYALSEDRLFLSVGFFSIRENQNLNVILGTSRVLHMQKFGFQIFRFYKHHLHNHLSKYFLDSIL